MTLKLGIFYLLAAFTVWAAAVVVLGKNIVRAAVALIFTFCGMAALYVLLDAEFLAAVQVLIYVGGITILLLFAIMLTSRISSATVRVINDQAVLSAVAAARAARRPDLRRHAGHRGAVGAAAAPRNDAVPGPRPAHHLRPAVRGGVDPAPGGHGGGDRPGEERVTGRQRQGKGQGAQGRG